MRTPRSFSACTATCSRTRKTGPGRPSMRLGVRMRTPRGLARLGSPVLPGERAGGRVGVPVVPLDRVADRRRDQLPHRSPDALLLHLLGHDASSLTLVAVVPDGAASDGDLASSVTTPPR